MPSGLRHRFGTANGAQQAGVAAIINCQIIGLPNGVVIIAGNAQTPQYCATCMTTLKNSMITLCQHAASSSGLIFAAIICLYTFVPSHGIGNQTGCSLQMRHRPSSRPRNDAGRKGITVGEMRQLGAPSVFRRRRWRSHQAKGGDIAARDGYVHSVAAYPAEYLSRR